MAATSGGSSGPESPTSAEGALVFPTREPLDGFDQPIEKLSITPWIDPLIDALGHDPRSAYVETYWLGVLGPSTTLLMRLLAASFDQFPNGFTIDLPDTARRLGLSASVSRHSPLMRSIARCEMFKLAVRTSPGSLAVRRRIPPLARHNLLRLPASLQEQHRSLTARGALAASDPASIQRSARQLALGLIETGRSPAGAEEQLVRWAVDPAVANEATAWADDHNKGRRQSGAVAGLEGAISAERAVLEDGQGP